MGTQYTATVHSSQRSMSMQKKSRSRFAHSAVLPLAIVVGQVLANPDGGVVVGGQAAISQRPGVTTVNQASNRAVINWRDFSIDPGDLTEFHQPGKDSVALNRVLGNDPSKLLGQLKANGNIWLVNPNGILFGPSAQVDVHGLLATTSDIVDQDFLNGHDNFSIPSPNADASVVNHGNISIGEYGLAGLVAPHVRNAGVIQGRLGQVVIAGAPTFTLDFYGDGLIQFEATSKVTENANSTEPLVRNDGKISVDGGDVLITANAAAGIVDEVINMDGIVEARSVGIENGAIVLQGGDAGIVHVAGHIDASGHDPGDTGGTVKVLGEKVGLFAETEIDASGDSGGGEVLIGGNFQGKGPEPNAKRTYVNGATSIAADALNQGDGGKVIVWSDEVTEFYGDVSANVAAGSGDGGLVEVSGKEALVFEGSVDVFAPHGKKGTVLIDPSNLTIIDAADGGDQDANLITDSQVLFSDPNLGEFNSNTRRRISSSKQLVIL
jgi:filamentous hemagglutinin family protein